MFRIFRRRAKSEPGEEDTPPEEGGPEAPDTDAGPAPEPDEGSEAAAGASPAPVAQPRPPTPGAPEGPGAGDAGATMPEPAGRGPGPGDRAPGDRTPAGPEPGAGSDAPPGSDAGTLEPEPAAPAVDEAPREAARAGLFEKFRRGLGRTRGSLAEGMGNLLLGKKEITEDALEDLETALLLADVGVDATREIIDRLTESVRRKELADTDALFGALGDRLREQIEGCEKTLDIDLGREPFVIMVVGVNGAGKTTTIGKLARHLQAQGVSVLLAAGDTFRAAAVEQLKAWGERNDVPVIAQGQGADSASVIYDAMAAARSRGIDVVLADTAGRLQNKQGLMDELAKIRRVMGKFGNEAPHETILVLDGNTGQNGISQARLFAEAVPVSGLVVTKLDGTARGGIVFAIARQTGLPIYYVGVGEGIDDLRPFEAEPFVAALLTQDDAAGSAGGG